MNNIEEGLIVSGTGHRLDKLGGYASWAYNLLVQLAIMILSALKPKKVISGMAIGWDQALAEAAVRLGIPFIAAIPFVGQESRWPKQSQEKYHELLAKAEEVVDASNGQSYHPRLMQVRNEWMVDNSHLVVALFDGTKGGTANCVKYAKAKGVRIKNYYKRWFKMYEAECKARGLNAHEEIQRTGKPAEKKATKKAPYRPNDPTRKQPTRAGNGTITVVRKGTLPAPGAIRVYVGRGSPLGNPFTHRDGTTAPHQVGTREEAVKAFATYLKEKLDQKDERIRKALNQIALSAKSGKQVELECYCAPHACHADVLAQVIAERLNQRPASG